MSIDPKDLYPGTDLIEMETKLAASEARVAKLKAALIIHCKQANPVTDSACICCASRWLKADPLKPDSTEALRECERNTVAMADAALVDLLQGNEGAAPPKVMAALREFGLRVARATLDCDGCDDPGVIVAAVLEGRDR